MPISVWYQHCIIYFNAPSGTNNLQQKKFTQLEFLHFVCIQTLYNSSQGLFFLKIFSKAQLSWFVKTFSVSSQQCFLAYHAQRQFNTFIFFSFYCLICHQLSRGQGRNNFTSIRDSSREKRSVWALCRLLIEFFNGCFSSHSHRIYLLLLNIFIFENASCSDKFTTVNFSVSDEVRLPLGAYIQSFK